MEEYKLIIDYPNYEVSNYGNVRNKTTGKPLKIRIKIDGYTDLLLYKTHLAPHRLVAIAFIKNPARKPCVDHINGDKSDNNAKNLRWVTRSENQQNHSIKKTNTHSKPAPY